MHADHAIREELSMPNVRVVIPAHAAADTIRGCVEAVLASALEVEVVVVDDGANGDLHQLLEGLPVTIRDSGGARSAAVSRNVGARGFAGEVLVFVDADVEPELSSLERLATPILRGEADATVGNYGSDVGRLAFASRYKQLYIHTVYRRRRGYLTHQFWTALGAVRASTFKELNGFPSGFPGAVGEDTAFGQRLTAAQQRILCCPDATGLHRKPFTVAGLIENDLRKGKSALRLEFEAGRPVLENRHTTARDIVAVGSLGLLCVCILAQVAMRLAGVAASELGMLVVSSALLVAVYVSARLDLLRTFHRQGPSFAVRSALLMVLLDFVRGIAVAQMLPRLVYRKRRDPVSASNARLASATSAAAARNHTLDEGARP